VTVADDASEPLSTAKEPGTGLGLSSVLRTARRAGGAVRIDSAPGVGTTVTLLLPEAPTA
jgi:signal transduction histidine kinase